MDKAVVPMDLASRVQAVASASVSWEPSCTMVRNSKPSSHLMLDKPSDALLCDFELGFNPEVGVSTALPLRKFPRPSGVVPPADG
jgi:hypothetical protein